MRALLVTLDFPPTSGGIQTMLREVVEHSDHALHVVAPADPGSSEYDAHLTVPVTRVRGMGGGRRGFVLPVAREALRVARSHRAEAVLFANVAAALAAPVLRRPYAILCHGAELRGSRQRVLARPVLSRAARVIANSSFTAGLATSLGASTGRTIVVNPGAPQPREADSARVAALRARFGLAGPVLLSVARLVPHKGIDLALRALRDIPDATYVVAGDGPERGLLERLASELGVASRVRFAGRLDDEDLAAAYASADVLLAPSRDLGQGGVEGFGIAILEASSFGVPAVGARSGGVSDAIHDGETGVLVPADDVQSLTRAVRDLLSDTERKNLLGNHARDLAASSRSWSAFVRQIDKCLAQVPGAAREGNR